MSDELTPGRRQAGPGRNREAERLFQIGGFWLGYEPGSSAVYYYWYDEKTRKARRKTTGCRDLDEAKLFLAKLALQEPPESPIDPANVTIAAVRRFYFAHHIRAKIRGRDVVRDKNGPRRAFALLSVYAARHLQNISVGEPGAPRVGDFGLALQHGFMRWCRDAHGLSCKSISTYLSYIKAGFRFCATPHLVTDARGREREAQLLSRAPYVCDSEDEISKVTGLSRSRRREWVPTDQELAATLDRCHTPERDSVLRFAIMALNTVARPEAVTELSVMLQVKFDRGIVDMNPPGRPQNKKVRPTIRLTNNLRGWFIFWNLDRPITYFGRPVVSVNNNTIQKAAKEAGIVQWKKFTKYTFRHYMATRVRRVPGLMLAREERATWMGHTDPEHWTTEQWYESTDPDYLENMRTAIDAVMAALHSLSKAGLKAPGIIPGTRFTVVGNQHDIPLASDENK